MKLVLALIPLLFATAAVAQETAPAKGQYGQNFMNRIKAMDAQSTQARISILQQGSSCVQAATDRDTMRACREKEREAMEQLHAKHRSQMDQMREHRQGGRAEGGQASGQGFGREGREGREGRQADRSSRQPQR